MGKKKDTYEPGLEDLTPKARAQSTGPSSQALDSLEQRGILRDQEPPAPVPRRTPLILEMGESSHSRGARKKSLYEPNLEDLTPRGRAQEPGPSSRTMEAIQQSGLLSDEPAPPPASSPRVAPVSSPRPVPEPQAHATNNPSKNLCEPDNPSKNLYEPEVTDLIPSLPSEQPKPPSRAMDSPKQRGLPREERTPSPQTPPPPPSRRSESVNAPAAPDRTKTPYQPSFEPLPGAHGPPGPTPRAVEALKQRGIWVEETLPPSAWRRQAPEPTGPSATALDALKQRGIWQEENTPPHTPGAAGPSGPAAVNVRPRQADVLTSQHAPSPSPQGPSSSAPTLDLRHTDAIHPQPEPPMPRPNRPNRRSWRVRRQGDSRVQHTLCIPCQDYAQLCDMAEQRGVSINAVILAILAEACTALRSGQGIVLVKSEPTDRVRRTLRIPHQVYAQLEAVAQQVDGHVNVVLLGVLAEACKRSVRA